jgi:hypothetical protein
MPSPEGPLYPPTRSGRSVPKPLAVRKAMSSERPRRRLPLSTLLFRAGVNPRVAQELLGHADLTTTMRYSHVEAADLKTGIARLGAFVASNAPEPSPESGPRPAASRKRGDRNSKRDPRSSSS